MKEWKYFVASFAHRNQYDKAIENITIFRDLRIK